MRSRGSRGRSRSAAKKTASTLPASISSVPAEPCFSPPSPRGRSHLKLGGGKAKRSFSGAEPQCFSGAAAAARNPESGTLSKKKARRKRRLLVFLSSSFPRSGGLSSLARRSLPSRGSSLPRHGVGLKGARSTFESRVSPPRPPSFPERGASDGDFPAVLAFGILASGEGGAGRARARAPFFYRVGGEPHLATEGLWRELETWARGPLAFPGAEACRPERPTPTAGGLLGPEGEKRCASEIWCGFGEWVEIDKIGTQEYHEVNLNSAQSTQKKKWKLPLKTHSNQSQHKLPHA
ncbi:hypothetical protein E2320_004223 [Naja naja]|nr:hypothetical protein E2320_004223 [Naja naja]